MVIKDSNTAWHSYSVQNKVNGVLVYCDEFSTYGHMLFAKPRTVLKIARLLGRRSGVSGLLQLTGPMTDHLRR